MTTKLPNVFSSVRNRARSYEWPKPSAVKIWGIPSCPVIVVAEPTNSSLFASTRSILIWFVIFVYCW